MQNDKPDRDPQPEGVGSNDTADWAPADTLPGRPTTATPEESAHDASRGAPPSASAPPHASPQGQTSPESATPPPEAAHTAPSQTVEAGSPARSSAWFHAADGSQRGPLDEETLHEAIAAERIRRDSLVWRRGMPDWVAAGDVPELQDVFATVPPPLPPPIAEPAVPRRETPPPPAGSPAPAVRSYHTTGSPDTIGRAARDEGALANFLQQRDATPWSRFWARSVDMWVLGMPVFLLLSFLLGATTGLLGVTPGTPALLDGVADILFGIISTAVSSCMIALSLAIFGTTPGKALYRIRVRPLTDKIGDDFWFRRELGVFTYGLGLGIWFVSLISCFIQYRRLARREPAHYDMGVARVTQEEIGWTRFLAGVVLSLAGGLVVVALGAILGSTGL